MKIEIEEIHLNGLNLKVFTEQDAVDYCSLNNINSDDIIILNLWNNELTDISGIKLFKNLEILYLNYNNIKSIKSLKNLTKLQQLYLDNNKLNNISVIKNLNNLEYLYIGNNEIKDISVIKDLNNLMILDIENLRLESDQVQYINQCLNLESLNCIDGFKDKFTAELINNNIELNNL